MSDSVVLDSNGVTLKVVDTITSVSDFSNNNGSSMDVSFNDETYTVVDDSTIDGEISDGNVNLITTFVTNMDGLFEDSSRYPLVLSVEYR